MRFKLTSNEGFNNGIVLYDKNRYLGSLLNKNNESLLSYVNRVPWTLPNQHPLVQFLILLSLDINQSDEFIYNTIAYRYQQAASTCQFTCLRNPGISFNQVIFPEKSHHTLFVVPFKGDEDVKNYFTVPLELLSPLTTLFTTDTKMRYDTTALTSKQIALGKSDYTVIQIDPFALGIGFVRYCRKFIEEGIDISLTPQAYITNIPLANFFIQHNQNVITNLINGDGISIEDTKWNKLPVQAELAQYLAFQRRQEAIIIFESFHHYLRMLSQGKFIGDKLHHSVYPDNGLSDGFNQLSWTYNYGSMDWAYRYLSVLKKYNRTDDIFKSHVKKFLRNNLNALTVYIKDPLWRHLYIAIFKDLTLIAL